MTTAKPRTALFEPIDTGAIFSPCRLYRYSLWRIWDEAYPIVAFIGLNPSTADETADDPTIRRCTNFARMWNFGGLVMLNIFAYRSTDPKALRRAADPIGPDNDGHLCQRVNECMMTVAAWGTHGAYLNRGEAVRAMLPAHLLRRLGLTKDGHPKHPLYLPGSVRPVKWEVAIER